MANDPRTVELLKRYGIAIAPPDDPMYNEAHFVILGDKLTEETPQEPPTEPQEPPTG